MNLQLSERYTSLNDLQKNELRVYYKDAPKSLILLDFLEELKGKNFNTQTAVRRLYENELVVESSTSLKNRYFKIRKKMLEQMESREKEEAKLLPLEQEYFRCRSLLNANNFLQARKDLQRLQKQCEDQNIFELLPDIFNQLIYCNQVLNTFEDNSTLYGQLALSNDLLYALRKQQLLAKKAYQFSVVDRNIETLEAMNQMKIIADEYKSHPRFAIYYHLTSIQLSAKLLAPYLQSTNEHFNALEKLTSKYPKVPSGFYESNSQYIIQYYVAQSRCSVEFMKGNMNAAYANMNEAWRLIDSIPVLRVKKSEPLYSNKITMEIATGKFEEALLTASELLSFLSNQKEHESHNKAYVQMALVYAYAYPELKCPNPKFIEEKINEYVKLLKRQNADQFAAYTRHILSFFQFYFGDQKEAIKTGTSEAVKKFCTKNGLNFCNHFFETMKKPSAEKIKELKTEMKNQLKTEMNIAVKTTLQRTLEILKGLSAGSKQKDLKYA